MDNHNVFAGAFVDRSGERRKDPDWLANAIQSVDCRFVPVWGDRCLVGGDPLQAVMLKRHQIESFVDDRELIFLGLFRNRSAFALAIAAMLTRRSVSLANSVICVFWVPSCLPMKPISSHMRVRWSCGTRHKYFAARADPPLVRKWAAIRGFA